MTDQGIEFAPGAAEGKQRILRAALRLFTEKGLCETSIRDIGAAAGLSNPALYKHYESKEALARELFVSCYRWLHSSLEGVVRGDFDSFPTQLAAYSSAFFEHFEATPEAIIYLSDNIQHFWPDVQAEVAGDTFIAQINRMLASAVDRDEISDDLDVDLTSAIIIGGIQQLARMWYLGLLEGPATDWSDSFTRRILALTGR
jgi:AcrR family transcriptional regulator